MSETAQMTTRSQEFAQRAFSCIQTRESSLKGAPRKEFASFAKRFPSLVHSCGLAQALTFAQVKAPSGYLDDVTTVIVANSVGEFCDAARNAPLPHYMRLTRETLGATGWLKRFCEGLLGDDDEQKGDDHAGMP